jgi:hypothetical protein
MVLKPNLEADRGMAQVMGQKVQHGMTRVNAWINVVIIIVLNPDSRVDPR